ncbi:hypothetical protein A3716_32370, partial [Alcanivorax sp. HI0011]
MTALLLGPFQSGSHAPLSYFSERVSAGFPSPARGYMEDPLDLNDLCVSRPAATFLFQVASDAMTGAGIFPGDVLVVDRSMKAWHGCLVIAEVAGEHIARRLQLKPRQGLLAENEEYHPIWMDDGVPAHVYGVVTWTVRNHRGGRSDVRQDGCGRGAGEGIH